MRKYRLDNAALIFPSILSKRETTLSRITVYLDTDIDAAVLQEALSRTVQRFPYYRVHLGFGYRWPFFYHSNKELKVQEDVYPPCTRMVKSEFLFHVWYGKNHIAIEFSHILTDATGMFIFLDSLLYEYLKQSTVIANQQGAENPFYPDSEQEDEQECAYRKYYKRMVNPKPFSHAFHLKDKMISLGQYHTTTLLFRLEDIQNMVKKYKTTVTVFFTAIYALSLAQISLELSGNRKKEIRLEIPINLRQIYKTKTMRNFCLFLAPSIVAADAEKDLSEIIKIIEKQFSQQRDSMFIEKQISRNVGAELNWFINNIPMFLKHVILKIVYKRLGEKQFSGFLTNLGFIEIPELFQSLIKYYTIVPAPSPVTKTNGAIYSYKDEMCITFGSLIDSAKLEKTFIENIQSLGFDTPPVVYSTKKNLKKDISSRSS